MITTGQTTQHSDAQHRAARRALTAWRLYRVRGRRRAVPLTPAQLERAERFHTFGVTR